MLLLMLSNYLLFFFFALHVTAAPVFTRQNSDGTTTLMTVTNTLTQGGPVTETCIITLKAIKDKDGKDAFEEVRKCTISVDRSKPGDSGGSSSSSSSTSTSTDSSSTSTSSSASSSTTDGSSSTSGSGSSTSTSASVTSSASPVISVIGASSIPISQVTGATVSGSSTSISASSAATSATSQSSGISAASSSTSSTATAGTAASDATGGSAQGSAQASEASATAAGAFNVPGKSISVLPIGLGVFAGISVIALIVVGLVTYERTKYRKAFRQRKLAESGAAMGYGGMAQRT